MDINRNQILSSCLELIAGISDKEYQKRVWIRGEGPECDDFDETICNFFQDGNGVIENYKDFGITNHQYNLLVKFRDELDIFCSGPALKYYSTQEFIDTSEWNHITLMAKEILRAFDYQKIDINKEQTFERFLRDIADISDAEYQERIWILAEGSESDDFTKIVQRYLNTAESILENHKDYGISEIQLHLLKKFHEEFKKFWTENDLPQLLIDTPEWTKITMMAKEVLEAFDYQK